MEATPGEETVLIALGVPKNQSELTQISVNLTLGSACVLFVACISHSKGGPASVYLEASPLCFCEVHHPEQPLTWRQHWLESGCLGASLEILPPSQPCGPH